jgi:hypothetical protein
MHMYTMMLQKVASRYAPNRLLSFDVVHVFAALKMIGNNDMTSRNALCSGLVLWRGYNQDACKTPKDARVYSDFKQGYEDDCQRKGHMLRTAIGNSCRNELAKVLSIP